MSFVDGAGGFVLGVVVVLFVGYLMLKKETKNGKPTKKKTGKK